VKTRSGSGFCFFYSIFYELAKRISFISKK